jgi:lipopolysaccharide transport system ATP-binding protein
MNLCQDAIWLHGGHLRQQGEPKKVVESYLQDSLAATYAGNAVVESIPVANAAPAPQKTEASDITVKIFEQIAHSEGWKTGRGEIESVQLLGTDGTPLVSAQGGERLTLVIRARAHAPMISPILGWFVRDRLGQSLFGEHTYTYVQPPLQLEAGQRVEARFDFQLPMLPNGDYSMTVSIAEGDPEIHTQHHWLHDAVRIHVASARLRYGLVGIRFNHVTLQPINTP